MTCLDPRMLTRSQLDVILAAWCEAVNVSYSLEHDEAFCVQSNKGYWLYLWYNSDENMASGFIKELESLLENDKLNFRGKDDSTNPG